jgi:predicted XRE-type DNA-binding protein
MYESFILNSLISKNSTLVFTIEQWELARRLKNSGISKEQLCQAFDDLDRMERDLGQLYNIPIASNTNSSFGNNLTNTSNISNNNHNHNNNAHSSSNKVMSDLFNKNFQLIINNTSNHKINNGNLTNNSTLNNNNTSNKNLLSNINHLNTSNNANNNNGLNSHTDLNNCLLNASNASTVVSNFFASLIDPELENKQVEEFKNKGEYVIQNEITYFVQKNDLKQSQIARMAGVNQAYVSKFLRGEFSDLSENGKTLIYKWYMRFLKNSNIYCK